METRRPTPSEQKPFHVTKRLLFEPIDDSNCFIFNALTGALDIASRREADNIQAAQSAPASFRFSASDEADLTARHYLFHSREEEEQFLENNIGSALRNFHATAPTNYTVCPTLSCNLACSYCFEGDSLTQKPKSIMTLETADRVLDAIRQMSNRERQSLNDRGIEPPAPWLALFGGEPFLPATKRVVERLVAGCADQGMLVAAITNGVNIKHFRSLFEEYRDVMAVFQVTLDGPQAVHDSRRHRLGGQGTFDEIVEGIDILVELGIDVYLRINVDATNMESIPELCLFAKSRGWLENSKVQVLVAPITIHTADQCSSASAQSALDELTFDQKVMRLASEHPIVAEACSPSHLRHLEHLVSILEPDRMLRSLKGGDHAGGPRYWYCESASGKEWIFTPDGHIYTCSQSVGKIQHSVGRFEPTLEIWDKPIREWAQKTILSNPKCRECSISTLCGGGCHFAAREHAHGQGSLIQIGLPRGVGQPDKPKVIEPFCSAAEEIVRGYLKSVGQRMAAEGRIGDTLQ